MNAPRSPKNKISLEQEVSNASDVLLNGGVIAYPTEYCFGLGCDPRNESAIKRLLKIKARSADQGVILIAANMEQVAMYADLAMVPKLDSITRSWPGPNTWLLPAFEHVSRLVRGKHSTIAMRIPEHSFCLKLLNVLGHPIVSTSANRTGEKEHLCADTIRVDIGVECDYIVDLPVGGAKQASTIRNALTGSTLR